MSESTSQLHAVLSKMYKAVPYITPHTQYRRTLIMHALVSTQVYLVNKYVLSTRSSLNGWTPHTHTVGRSLAGDSTDTRRPTSEGQLCLGRILLMQPETTLTGLQRD